MGITEEKTSQVSQMGYNSQILRIGISDQGQSVFVSPRDEYTRLGSAELVPSFSSGTGILYIILWSKQYSMSCAMACICSADGGGSHNRVLSCVSWWKRGTGLQWGENVEEAEGNFENDKWNKVSAFLWRIFVNTDTS